MGFDVIGKNSTSEEGAYFRANVWYWRPLAEYLEHVAPEITASVQYLYSNDGDGLDAADSIRLADILDVAIASGATQAYIENRDAEIAAMPDETCELCGGTGVRTDEIAKKFDMTGCNGCDDTGKHRPWVASYHMDLELVKEFSTFVRHSGGFQIF